MYILKKNKKKLTMHNNFVGKLFHELLCSIFPIVGTEFMQMRRLESRHENFLKLHIYIDNFLKLHI